VRKSVAPALQEKQDVRKKQREEERIKEVEVEIEKRKEEQKISEEKKRYGHNKISSAFKLLHAEYR